MAAAAPSHREHLERCLSEIEATSPGEMFTLTLHKIGTFSNDNVTVGDVKDRKCRWKVDIYRERSFLCSEDKEKEGKLDWDAIRRGEASYVEPKKPMEEDLFKLEGVYDSYAEIELAVTQLRLANAVELFEMGEGGSLKSFRKLVSDNGTVQWELTCGACGHVMKCATDRIHTLCQTQGCCDRLAKPTKPGQIMANNFQYLIPPTILDDIHAGDGCIYHASGGRMSIVTTLGTVTRV